MKRKCGGRRFTLIFEELRFLAISQSPVSFFFYDVKRKQWIIVVTIMYHMYVMYV